MGDFEMPDSRFLRANFQSEIQNLKSKIALTSVGFLACVLLLLISPADAGAQVLRVEDLQAAVMKDSAATTYLDLIKQVFPDAQMDASAGAKAHHAVPLDHLFGDYRNKTYEGEIKIGRVDAVWIKNDGQLNLLLLIEAESSESDLFTWGEMNVLALFQLRPNLKLLDARDVQADRETWFWDTQPLVSIHPRKDAVFVANTHHNSSQGYLILTLISVEKGRLNTAFEMPTILNMNGCGQTFDETPSFSLVKGAGNTYHRILAKVELVKEADAAACEKRTRAYKRLYRATLVWNPSKSKFESLGRELEALEKFNERHF
jgi:hypothetical protein